MNVDVEYDNIKEYNNVIDKLEPLIDFLMSKNDMESLKGSAIVSIAISLKRIADVICRPPIVAAEMTPEMREEWEKTNITEARAMGYAIFNKS